MRAGRRIATRLKTGSGLSMRSPNRAFFRSAFLVFAKCFPGEEFTAYPRFLFSFYSEASFFSPSPSLFVSWIEESG
jgi:hypothetical protein